MKLLILSSLNDIKEKFLSKTLIEHFINQYKHRFDVKICSKFVEVRNIVDNKLLEKELDLKKILIEFKEDFILVVGAFIADIDFDKLLLYHKNHPKTCTVVFRNLVKDKTIPIYKMNDKKDVISWNKKRYINCGVYIFKKETDFSNMKTLNIFIEELIERRELRAFIHTGYHFKKQQKFDDVKQTFKHKRFLK